MIKTPLPRSQPPLSRNSVEKFYNRPINRVIFLCLIMIVTGTSLPLFYRWLREGSAFKIKTVSVTQTSDVRAKEIEIYLRDYLGKPLYGIDLEAVRRQAEQHPWIKSAAIRRLPPHELQINVRERKALAMVSLDQLYLVDEEGELFKLARKEEGLHLPIVMGISKRDWKKTPAHTKEQIKEIVSALQEHQMAQKPGGEISELHVSKGLRLTVYFANGLEVILGKDEYQKKWNKLVQILLLLRDKKNDLAYAYLDDYPNSNQVAVRFKKVRS